MTEQQPSDMAQRRTLLDRVATAPLSVLQDMLTSPDLTYVEKQIVASTIDGRLNRRVR